MNLRRFQFALLPFVILAGLIACDSNDPPWQGNFRLQVFESTNGFNRYPLRGQWISGLWQYDLPGAGGTAYDLFYQSGNNWWLVWPNGRYNAVWAFAFYGGPCNTYTELWEVHYHDTIPFVCPRYVNEFYSYEESTHGYLAHFIPETYWTDDSEPDVLPAGHPATMSAAGNQYLYPDSNVVYSPNGQFRLQYQGDGNLVLLDTSTSPWTPIWSSGTNNNNPGSVAMQGDGNFVIYDGNGNPVWSTGTAGYDGAYLAVLDNGTMVLLTYFGFSLWWSDSGS